MNLEGILTYEHLDSLVLIPTNLLECLYRLIFSETHVGQLLDFLVAELVRICVLLSPLPCSLVILIFLLLKLVSDDSILRIV